MNLKSQKESNLSHLSHYPLYQSESELGLLYYFVADSGIKYELLFAPDSDYLTDYPFADTVFSFTIIAQETGPKDPLIKSTVAYVLGVVFEAYPDLIITYICSSKDEKQRNRRLLFGQWYHEYGQAFKRLTHTDKDKIYSAAIFREDHPHQDLIREAFNGIYADK